MASITSSGIGSGLDVAGIVQQLVAAEGQPVEARIARQEARVQAELSAFGSLKSALADFRDKLGLMKNLNTFLTRKAVSGNEESYTAAVGASAQPARYSIEVVQLAQAQKLASGAFESSDAVVGTGTLAITVGAESFSVEITEENQTLAGIRDAINTALDNKGVAATIVNADAGSYLILSAGDTGVDNAITVVPDGGDGGLATLSYDPGNGLAGLTESVAAQDALVRIDGLDVGSSGNTVAGAIDGVTIDLVTAVPGEISTLNIENDEAAVRQTITGFVESYNKLVETFDKLTSYDSTTTTAAPLLGDAAVRGIRDRVRRELSAAVGGLDAPFATLGEAGIELQLDGKLEISDDRLSTVLGSDFSRFGQLFAATDGYATRLHTVVDDYLGSDGILETRTAGLNGRIEVFGDQRDRLADRLVALETRLMRQFTALDTLIGQLSSTSNFLAQQLANLPGYTRDD
jgi:flagellar hook-associated protein 2